MSHSLESPISGLHAVLSSQSAKHYTWGEHCDGWHLVQNETLSVILERMPPGAREVPHYHTRAQQFFYVLTGTLQIDLDGVAHQLNTREGLLIPPGKPHLVVNTSNSVTEFLVVSHPPSHGDRVVLPSEADCQG